MGEYVAAGLFLQEAPVMHCMAGAFLFRGHSCAPVAAPRHNHLAMPTPIVNVHVDVNVHVHGHVDVNVNVNVNVNANGLCQVAWLMRIPNPSVYFRTSSTTREGAQGFSR